MPDVRKLASRSSPSPPEVVSRVEAFWRALGSRKWFSTMTVDQAPKWVVPGRLGVWLGGRQRFEDSDVWLTAGGNPLVSMQSAGFANKNPVQALRSWANRPRWTKRSWSAPYTLVS